MVICPVIRTATFIFPLGVWVTWFTLIHNGARQCTFILFALSFKHQFFLFFFCCFFTDTRHTSSQWRWMPDETRPYQTTLHNLHTWSPSWLYVPSFLGGGKGGNIRWCACIVKKRRINQLETLIPLIKTLLGALYLSINSHWCRRCWGCCAYTGWTIQLPFLPGETNTKFYNTIPTNYY